MGGRGGQEEEEEEEEEVQREEAPATDANNNATSPAIGRSTDTSSSSSTQTVPTAVPEKNEYDADGDGESFDHGWKAWSQVMASFILFINTWGIVTSYGVFQTYYESNTLSHESPSTISWVGSVQSFLLLFVGAATGPLFDAGYTRYLLLFGWLMLPLGLMMTSISSQFWHFLLAQGFCLGLGSSSLFVPSVAILPQYFKRKRAFANGIAATGSGVGGIIYPIMFRQLQLKIGFAWSTRVLGFMALALVLIALSFMRVRFQPEHRRALIQLSAFKDPVYALFCTAQFIGFLGLYNMLVYIQPYAIDERIMDPQLAFYLVPILNGSSMFGRVIPNYIADYTGPLNVLTPMTCVAGTLALGWIGVHTSAGLIVLVVIYGFASGAYVSIPPVAIATITPDMRDFGTRLGMCFVLCGIGSLVGTPIGGAIVNRSGEYLGIKLLAGMCLMSAGIIMSIARFIKTGPRLLVKA